MVFRESLIIDVKKLLEYNESIRQRAHRMAGSVAFFLLFSL
jgi:hypothetical protein